MSCCARRWIASLPCPPARRTSCRSMARSASSTRCTTRFFPRPEHAKRTVPSDCVDNDVAIDEPHFVIVLIVTLSRPLAVDDEKIRRHKADQGMMPGTGAKIDPLPAVGDEGPQIGRLGPF